MTGQPRPHRSNRHRPAASIRSLGRALIEALETRQMLSSVNIADFGANPADSGDDYAAIQAAINAAGTGGSVFFPAGTYRLSQPLIISSSRTLTGQTSFSNSNWNAAPLAFNSDVNSALIPNGDFYDFRVSGSDVTFSHLTMEGRGIWTENQSAPVNHIRVDNNWFRQPTGSTQDLRSSFQFQSLLTNSSITNNVFSPLTMENGIYGYYYNNLVIANNAFIGGVEAIHITNLDEQGRDLLIEQNYFGAIRRMAIEYQHGGWNTIVQDNYYELPTLSTNASVNSETFAYSIVADVSHNTITRRNTTISTYRPDGLGARVMFELGGFNIQMYDNYSVGGMNVIAVNGTNATGVVRDNRISGYINAPYNYNNATAVFTNNTANTQLTWDINRGKPGPNHRLGDTPITDPTPDPDPDPQPDPGIPNAPSLLSGTNVGLSQINLHWTDNSTDETGFELERLGSDGVTWIVIADLVPDTTTFTLADLAVGTRYQLRVRAFNQNGFSAASNIAKMITPVPDGGAATLPIVSATRNPRPALDLRSTDDNSVLPVTISDT